MEQNLSKNHRSDSFESIPDADFLIQLINNDLSELHEEELVSEYKRKELNEELQPEPLLTEDKSRFVLFPIKHTDVS